VCVCVCAFVCVCVCVCVRLCVCVCDACTPAKSLLRARTTPQPSGSPPHTMPPLVSTHHTSRQLRAARAKVRGVTARINNMLKGFPGEPSEKGGRLCIAAPAGAGRAVCIETCLVLKSAWCMGTLRHTHTRMHTRKPTHAHMHAHVHTLSCLTPPPPSPRAPQTHTHTHRHKAVWWRPPGQQCGRGHGLHRASTGVTAWKE
jgi:hypothetical protein